MPSTQMALMLCTVILINDQSTRCKVMYCSFIFRKWNSKK